MPDRASVLRQAVDGLVSTLDANVLLLVSDKADFVGEVIGHALVPVVLVTGEPAVRDNFHARARKCILLHEGVSGGLTVLEQVKEILLGSFLDGTLRPGDRALALMTNVEALDAILFFDVDKDIELTRLREELKGRISMEVTERVLRLAGELAREGREGSPIGTLFIIGDTPAVLRESRQIVMNPFLGHPEAERDLMRDQVWETVKEFAQIDGAFVVREDGVVEAAGRYVDLDTKVEIQGGLGGRHLAAASITRATRAVAVVVSESGTVRVFKDGRMIVRVSTL